MNRQYFIISGFIFLLSLRFEPSVFYNFNHIYISYLYIFKTICICNFYLHIFITISILDWDHLGRGGGGFRRVGGKLLLQTIRKSFLFNELYKPFRESHRVKGCDKNVSLFLIVRRKMAYILISLKSEFILPPRSPNLNPLDFYLWGYMKD